MVTFRERQAPDGARKRILYIDTDDGTGYAQWMARPDSEVRPGDKSQMDMRLDCFARGELLPRDKWEQLTDGAHLGVSYRVSEFKSRNWRCFATTIKGVESSIILLHTFAKKSQKTPKRQLNRAIEEAKRCIETLNRHLNR